VLAIVAIIAVVAVVILISGRQTDAKRSQTPETKTAHLYTQAAAALQLATANTSRLMSDGQAYSAQSGALALSPPSKFQLWCNTVRQPTTDMTNSAYHNVTNMYSSDRMPVPATLQNWKKHDSDALAEINAWQGAETIVLVNENPNIPSSTIKQDKLFAAADDRAFKADLAEAQADVKQLSENN